MELFVKILSETQPLTIYAKCTILDISQGYDYTPSNTKWKPGKMTFISQIIISSSFKFNFISNYYLELRRY